MVATFKKMAFFLAWFAMLAALPFPGQTVALAEDQTRLMTIAAWESRFRERMANEHLENLDLAESGDSFLHYQLAYAIDGFAAQYEATGNTEYLNHALTYIWEVMASAVVSSEIPNSQYRDDFKGWGASRHPDPKIDGEEYPLFESYFWRYVARLLRVMDEQGITRQQSSYQAAYDDVLAFLEVQIFDKWYARGQGNIFRSRTHMASHWAYIALELSRLTKDGERRQKAITIGQKISQSIKDNIKNHPSVPGGYFWDSVWESEARPGQDVNHGNAVVSYVVEAVELGEDWTLKDIRALSLTFQEVIWRVDDQGEASFAGYVDGSGQGNGWFSDGFIKLGRFNPDIQRKLENHSVGRSTQFFGNGALNAKRLGVPYDD